MKGLYVYGALSMALSFTVGVQAGNGWLVALSIAAALVAAGGEAVAESIRNAPWASGGLAVNAAIVLALASWLLTPAAGLYAILVSI